MTSDELQAPAASQEILAMIRRANKGDMIGIVITLDKSTGEVETVSVGGDASNEDLVELLDHVKHQLRGSTPAAEGAVN
jgi:hypothetical protein